MRRRRHHSPFVDQRGRDEYLSPFVVVLLVLALPMILLLYVPDVVRAACRRVGGLFHGSKSKGGQQAELGR